MKFILMAHQVNGTNLFLARAQAKDACANFELTEGDACANSGRFLIDVCQPVDRNIKSKIVK
jgi:hypothetical protein